MEDEDSKIRRNLMAVSVVVVLAWWLELPLSKIGEKLLGVEVSPNFQWRAWIAATISVAYFSLRFRFSNEHAEGVSTLKLEGATVRTRLLTRWLNWETSWFAKWGTTPPVFGDGFVAMAGPYKEESRRIVKIIVSEVTWGHHDTFGQFIPPPQGRIAGQAQVSVYRVHTNGGSESAGLGNVGFELSPLQRTVLKTWTNLLLVIYSKASTSLLVPWAMAACAFVVCMIKLSASMASAEVAGPGLPEFLKWIQII